MNKELSEQIKLAKKHVGSINENRCIAVVETSYNPANPKHKYYGFIFPKKNNVYVGKIITNDDHSKSKVMKIL